MGYSPSSHHAGMSAPAYHTQMSTPLHHACVSAPTHPSVLPGNTQVCPPPLTGSAGGRYQYTIVDCLHQYIRQAECEFRGQHPQCWRQMLPLTEVLFQPVGMCQGFRTTSTRSISCSNSSVSKWRHGTFWHSVRFAQGQLDSLSGSTPAQKIRAESSSNGSELRSAGFTPHKIRAELSSNGSSRSHPALA